MPFGKYQGQDLAEVPSDYLEWCLDNLDRLGDALRLAMEMELDERESGPLFRDPPAAEDPPGLTQERVLELITQVYRKVSLRFHPDRGGSHQAMTAINEFMDQLRERLLEK